MDRPTSNHSNETGDVALSDDKIASLSGCQARITLGLHNPIQSDDRAGVETQDLRHSVPMKAPVPWGVCGQVLCVLTLSIVQLNNNVCMCVCVLMLFFA